MNIQTLLATAVEAVWEASRCCERISEEFHKHRDQLTKDDDSPVTIADYASQALVLHRLAERTPDLPVVAEESGADIREKDEMRGRVANFAREFNPAITADGLVALLDHNAHGGGKKGRFWTLDPIDGTKGYLRGGQYAVALALIENGQPILGVMGCPRYSPGEDIGAGVVFYGGETIEACVLGSEGASPRPIHVGENLSPNQAKLCESVESGHTNQELSARLVEMLGISKDVVRIDSQTKYAAVAHGAAALYMRLPVKKGYREKIWDHAAGVAVIQAAGGKVTDLNGKALDFGQGETLEGNRGVLASNGAMHHATLAAIKALTPEESHWE